MAELGQSKYDFKYLTFPSDLGMDYMGHYMVININVPTKGFSLTSGGVQNSQAAGKFTGYFNTLPYSPDFNSGTKLDALRFGNQAPEAQTIPDTGSGLNGVYNAFNQVWDAVGDRIGSSANGNAAALSLPRQTRRIAESIALFMPQDITFVDVNEYENIELSSFAGKVGAMPLSFLDGLFGTDLTNTVTGAFKAGAQLLSTPINPAVEVLFSTKKLRNFDFQFLFAPRNEAESESLKGIIKTLRFHASPELNNLGFTWIPPADFDITFFKHGRENLNIMRINTCVLDAIQVQYSPSGVYSTFSNGHPVSVQMSLHFRELEPVHKERVIQGF